jgi:hypothetical protein
MAQKSHFKAVKTGTYVKRNLFPQWPNSELQNPKTFKTARGELLLDGCWKYLRKPSASPFFSPHFSQSTCLPLLLTRLLPRRLYLRLGSRPHLGPLVRYELFHPLLVPRLPRHDAPPPQREGRRQVCQEVREGLGGVQEEGAVLVRVFLFPSFRRDLQCSPSSLTATSTVSSNLPSPVSPLSPPPEIRYAIPSIPRPPSLSSHPLRPLRSVS